MQGNERLGPGNRKYPDGKNVIKSGSSLTVTGTLYFPTQEINIQGEGSNVGANAPATSFIAYKVNFAGTAGSKVEVKVDHVTAGLPPILPKAEDGVRLVQ